MLEKKVFNLLCGQGVYPPYALSGPTTKKNNLLCVFPYSMCVLKFKTNIMIIPNPPPSMPFINYQKLDISYFIENKHFYLEKYIH